MDVLVLMACVLPVASIGSLVAACFISLLSELTLISS